MQSLAETNSQAFNDFTPKPSKSFRINQASHHHLLIPIVLDICAFVISTEVRTANGAEKSGLDVGWTYYSAK